MAISAALRYAVNRDPDRFDRVKLFSEVHDPMGAATRKVLAARKPVG